MIAVALIARVSAFLASTIGRFDRGPRSDRISFANAGCAQESPSIPEKNIAILPFENLSRDPDNTYFADGIHDEILTDLSKIADLKVISGTSTERYKSAPDNLPEIGKQLRVAQCRGGSRAKER